MRITFVQHNIEDAIFDTEYASSASQKGIQSINRKCHDYVYMKWEYWSTM